MTIRYYFALTNLCNRACELCSCHSDPSRGTHLSLEQFKEVCHMHPGQPYEAQLEGGEPTIHTDFWDMVEFLNEDPLCERIVLCTNAVTMPLVFKEGVPQQKESVAALCEWIGRFKKPFQLKPSVNSHLLRHGKHHMTKMVWIAEAVKQLNSTDVSLTYNVRRIPEPMTADGERWITDDMKRLGLYEMTNDFEYQRYGKGKEEEGLALPFVVSNPVKFHLISPDGKDFGTDLIARADHMEFMG